MSNKKLHRVNNKRMICGVCTGLADYFNIDVTIVRIIFVLISVFKGVGLLMYILCAILMPADMDEDIIIDAEVKDADEEPAKKTKKSSGKTAPHSDAEFDSYFKSK